jgi:hypothetical protein
MSDITKPLIVQQKVVPSNFFKIVSDTIKWVNKKISADGSYRHDGRIYNSILVPSRTVTIDESLVMEYAKVLFNIVKDQRDNVKYNGYFALANDINGFVRDCIKQWVKVFNKANINIVEAEYDTRHCEITIKPTKPEHYIL